MRKIISNILIAVIVMLSSYLLIANVLHFFYVRKHDNYNFNSEIMISIKEQLDEVIDVNEKIQGWENNKLTKEDLVRFKELSDRMTTNLNNNILLTYNGETKIYAKDLFSILSDEQIGITNVIAYLDILKKHDASIETTIEDFKTNWLKDAYSYDGILQETINNYQYKSLRLGIYPSILSENTSINALIYHYQYQVKTLNKIFQLGLELVGDTNE